MSFAPSEIKKNVHTIASAMEWEQAERVLAHNKKRHKGILPSGYKLCRKKNNRVHFSFLCFGKKETTLSHSFLYLKDEESQKDTLIAVSKHYYLGAGSFGRVKIVEDATGKQYALKVLKKGVKDNEKEILKRLGYLFFTGENPKKLNTSYVLMTLFDGINIEDYLAIYGAVLTEEQRLSLAYRMAKAIQLLHEKHIVHGDLKPSNFMLQPNGGIVVVDFSGSHIVSEQAPTFTGKLVGAPFYRTPENKKRDARGKLQSEGTISKRTDMYAFGKIILDDLKIKRDTGLLNSASDVTVSTIVSMFVNSKDVSIPEDRLAERLIAKNANALEKIRIGLNTTCARTLEEKLTKKRQHLVVEKKPNTVLEEKQFQSSKERELLTLEDNKPAILVCVDSKNMPKDFKYGDLCTFGQSRQGIAVSPQSYVKFVSHSNRNLSLLELVKKSGRDLKEIKELRLKNIKELTTLTNNIEELLALFNVLKLEETNHPFLRKERSFFRGNVGMTNSWKEALKIFKVRAMELAKNELNFQHTINNPEKYTIIFQDSRARVFHRKPNHLKEFERCVSSVLRG